MTGKKRLRSREWFDNPHDPGMTALYLERYLNYGLTFAELRGRKPIIGIAQSGSDLSPCNRHHKIGRGSCRERVCQYGYISVVAVILTITKTTTPIHKQR